MQVSSPVFYSTYATIRLPMMGSSDTKGGPLFPALDKRIRKVLKVSMLRGSIPLLSIIIEGNPAISNVFGLTSGGMEAPTEFRERRYLSSL